MGLDISKIRDDFPILKRMVHGFPLVYFDNGATTQKPIQVINAITKCYTETNSNVHRGVHYLSEQSTEASGGDFYQWNNRKHQCRCILIWRTVREKGR
jgi:cysteine desulfurase/selenocysteine lyase